MATTFYIVSILTPYVGAYLFGVYDALFSSNWYSFITLEENTVEQPPEALVLVIMTLLMQFCCSLIAWRALSAIRKVTLCADPSDITMVYMIPAHFEVVVLYFFYNYTTWTWLSLMCTISGPLKPLYMFIIGGFTASFGMTFAMFQLDLPGFCFTLTTILYMAYAVFVVDGFVQRLPFEQLNWFHHDNYTGIVQWDFHRLRRV